MTKITLVTGGSRSGKSRFAQELAESHQGKRIYIATCPVFDNELEDRILRHRKDREGRNWHTIEETLDLAATFNNIANQPVTILLDCVTLWINNLMYSFEQQHKPWPSEDDITEATKQMLNAAKNISGNITFVTNEVGLGIVPENAISRHYRDLVGRANQAIAAQADAVYLITCGIPQKIK